MNVKLAKQTVGTLVAERPSRSRLFERWGIDYCCGGKQPLAASCSAQSVDLEAVIRDLQEEAREPSDEETDWTTAPLSALTAHIVTTHHAYLREALPRLSFLTEKVKNAHSQRHPELSEVARVFAAFRTDMEAHAQTEEQVLFPSIEKLDREEKSSPIASSNVQDTIQTMEKEHEEAGEALATLRRLTAGYSVPQGACATYRAMLDALAELEANTHQHVHKENSILFPRAEAKEATLIARQTAPEIGHRFP